ncbi:MAG: aspartate carbamoyltransferase regulatory subunit [Chlamydiales bacterium]|nr:aspartate carbamoyltransferase regulatory subunit [Chlamydiales bacterium]
MTLSVAAIGEGTVIDHIPAGEGMRIVRLLELAGHRHQVTLGLNLPSKRLGYKDLIKVEGREVTEEEASQIAIFAPHATINIIRGYRIAKKFTVTLPEKVSQVLCCPNERCITNHESTPTRFEVSKRIRSVQLKCYYCEKSFAHDTF